MKYQSLVSSTTPSDLQEWLGQELEDRGIDNVYARSILSLLQQDYVDTEPWECQHLKKRQLKYGGPENLYSATKSKHQKWKTWGKQMLSTSNSCCKTVFSDLERIKKQAAVDCLRSASDYVNDIEELIDEVYMKLKNFTKLKGEKDEIHLRNVNKQAIIDPFFIPPSSPTDEIEKYLAAFPPLNNKHEKATDIYQHNVTKNAWCRECVKKNSKSHISNKCNQPIIPYSPLKQIKGIYQNMESTNLLDHNKIQVFSVENLTANKQNCIETISYNWQIIRAERIKLTKDVLSSVKGSWKGMCSFITKTITLPLDHLFLIQTDIGYFNKMPMQHEEKNYDFDNNLKISTNEESVSFMKTLLDSNFVIMDIKKSSNKEKTKNICSTLISFQKVFSKNFIQPKYIPNFSNDSDYQPSSLDFNVLSVPCTREKKISLVGNISNSLEKSKDLKCLSVEENELDINFINSRTETLGEFLFLPEVNTFSILSNRENIWRFNPDITQLYDSFETETKCNQLLPSIYLVANNEMFYCVDDISNSQSIHDGLDLFISPKSSFLPVLQNYSITNCLYERKLSNKENCGLHLKLDIDGEKQFYFDNSVLKCKRIGQELLKKVLFIDKIFHGHSPHNNAFLPSTSFKKIASLIPSNNQKKSGICIKSEVEELKSQAFADLDKSPIYVQHCKDTIQASSTADWPNKNVKRFDEMWLLYWGDNHNFIAHTWQKDFTTSIDIKNVELTHDSEVILALSKEIEEDGDELLKGLGSIPSICDDPIVSLNREIPISVQEEVNCNENFNSQTSNTFICDEEISMLQQTANDQNDTSILSSVVDTSFAFNNMGSDSPDILYSSSPCNQFSFDNIKTTDTSIHSSVIDSSFAINNMGIDSPDILHSSSPRNQFSFDNIRTTDTTIHSSVIDTSFAINNMGIDSSDILHGFSPHNQLSFDNDLKATDYADLSAFPNSYENVSSFESAYYVEGGGLSFASDSFLEYPSFVSPYERSCSLDDLDLENDESGYLESCYQKRLRCTSETDEDIKQILHKQNQSQFQKRLKQKITTRKRPCLFYLQGVCRRPDCKYSHDLSSTTCRFWKEGSCFKGVTCPFLHGYIKANNRNASQLNELLKDDKDNSYSLESEADFPSLLSAKSEPSKLKSAPINIVHAKEKEKL